MENSRVMRPEMNEQWLINPGWLKRVLTCFDMQNDQQNVGIFLNGLLSIDSGTNQSDILRIIKIRSGNPSEPATRNTVHLNREYDDKPLQL